MKLTLLITILAFGLLPGISPQADAQHCRQQSQVFISGYQRCGTPVYRVRYIAGYDRCGRAIWRTRGLNRHERSRYYRSRSHNRHAGYGHSRISYTTSSGRGYSYRYHRNSSSRCRSW